MSILHPEPPDFNSIRGDGPFSGACADSGSVANWGGKTLSAARVVARSPDQATAFDRRSPRPTFPGDLRSRRVARSGDRATTANGGGRKLPENIRAPFGHIAPGLPDATHTPGRCASSFCFVR